MNQNLNQRVKNLEKENTYLKEEIKVLKLNVKGLYRTCKDLRDALFYHTSQSHHLR